jgi:small nuclear ribonucleoprotein (snRNP)-like protein
MNFFITDKQKKQDVDWIYKAKEIDKFWQRELSDLIDYGGETIRIRMANGNKIKGTLTGVNMEYLQINNSLKVSLDKVRFIFIDGKDKKKRQGRKG